MAITVNCPSCQQAYSVPDDKAGKKFRCKSCQSVVEIPLARSSGSGTSSSGSKRAAKSEEEADPFAGLPTKKSSSSGKRAPAPAEDDEEDMFGGVPSSKSSSKRNRYDEEEDDDFGAADDYDEDEYDDEYSSRRAPKKSKKKRRRGGSGQLAGLGQRFVGAFIDGFAGMVLCGPGVILMIANDPDMGGDEGLFFLGFGLVALGGLAVLALQVFLMATRSQSIGKYFAKTQVWDYESQEPAGFVKVFLLRSMVNGMIAGIPCIGPIYNLVDILMIFSEERRCLHDKLANTYVVDIS